MKKVLFVSALQIFPPKSGGMLRSSGLATALSENDCEVHVYSLVGRKSHYSARRAVKERRISENIVEYVEKNIFWAAVQMACYWIKLPPFWVTLFLYLYIPKKLRSELIWCDLVIADFPYLHPVFSRIGKIKILNIHNVENKLWRKSFLQRIFIAPIVKFIELRAVNASEVVVGCSADDIGYFNKHSTSKKTPDVSSE